MALCIAKVAASGVPLDGPPGLHEVGQRFLDWLAADPADVGNQTCSVLSGARGPADLAASAAAYARDHERSAGSGSLMRTGPVALAHLGDGARLQAAASAVSALTHDDPLASDACVLWCCAIDQAVRSGRLDGPRCGLVHLPDDRRAFWAGIIEEAETKDPGTFRPNGFVATALQAAWAAVCSTRSSTGRRHIEMALRAAVAIGDDTDTVASLVGSLLGGASGAAAFPFVWRRRLGGWPGLTHADLVTLGVLIALGGVPDKNGWPGVTDLMPMYREELNPEARWSPLTLTLVWPGATWRDWPTQRPTPSSRSAGSAPPSAGDPNTTRSGWLTATLTTPMPIWALLLADTADCHRPTPLGGQAGVRPGAPCARAGLRPWLWPGWSGITV